MGSFPLKGRLTGTIIGSGLLVGSQYDAIFRRSDTSFMRGKFHILPTISSTLPCENLAFGEPIAGVFQPLGNVTGSTT
jgi:hypothetical protein